MQVKPFPIPNAQFSRFRKLLQRKHREKEGLFLAEGQRTVEQIAAAGFLEMEGMVVTQRYADTMPIPKGSSAIWIADDEQFAALSDTGQPQGILAVCRMDTQVSVDGWLSSRGGLLVVADALQDPGNLGSVYRSASWFGADGLILGSGTTDLYNPKTVRSTAGALGSLLVLSGVHLPETLTALRDAGWQIYALDAGEGAEPLPEIVPAAKSVLVVGNEGNGIQPDLRSLPGVCRTVIPGNASYVESLNAAISASVALFHFSTLRG